MTNLIIEAIFVGLITGVIGLIVSTFFMYIFSKQFSIKKYTFWPSVFLSFFITGFLIHIIFEYNGINKTYCVNKLNYNYL